MDRGGWQTAVHGVAKSLTLSRKAHTDLLGILRDFEHSEQC